MIFCTEVVLTPKAGLRLREGFNEDEVTALLKQAAEDHIEAQCQGTEEVSASDVSFEGLEDSDDFDADDTIGSFEVCSTWEQPEHEVEDKITRMILKPVTLVGAGRRLLDDLSDAGETHHPETGVEFDSVRAFRLVLEAAEQQQPQGDEHLFEERRQFEEQQDAQEDAAAEVRRNIELDPGVSMQTDVGNLHPHARNVGDTTQIIAGRFRGCHGHVHAIDDHGLATVRTGDPEEWARRDAAHG